MMAGGALNPQQEQQDADYPAIRFNTVDQQANLEPQYDYTATGWEAVTPDNILKQSAVAVFFARGLYKHLDIPVGIISCAYGGTPQQAWLPEARIRGIGNCEEELNDARRKMPADVNSKTSTVLYNAMIHPAIPYTIRGVCWYQGEANTAAPETYPVLLKQMVDSWRQLWDNEKMPFIIAQLAGWSKAATRKGWVDVQLEQFAISQRVPGVATVLTYDVGDSLDIHPKNKQEVGRRFVLAARSVAYGEKILSQGPVMKTWKYSGNRILLTFTNTGKGLQIKDGGTAINGFSVAGEEKNFQEVRAVLKGKNGVELEVPAGMKVRYIHYADKPYNSGVNLYNSDGLPAVPFQTDYSHE